jgi:hypothetical protein
MDGLIECLKDCNVRLSGLRTKDFRFAAWITFSTQHDVFMAGVDVYSADGKTKTKTIAIAPALDGSPIGAMNQINRKVREWERAGRVIIGR